MNKNSRLRRRLRPMAWDAMSLALRPTTRWRVLPDYLIVGTQRGGTTSLQNTLSAHPNITSARLQKGVHFFDTNYHRGADWYRLQFPTAAYARAVARSTGVALRVGEASPYYMFHPLGAERIRLQLPDVKLIAVLRDPVERAISHYKHEVRRGNEELDMQAALEAEAARLAGEEQRIIDGQPVYNSFAYQTYSYVARGHYASQIDRLYGRFGRDHVLVIASEHLFAEPESVLERVYRFIDVPAQMPAEFPRMNPTTGSPIPQQVRERLSEEFADSNEELFSLLGERFPWQ